MSIMLSVIITLLIMLIFAFLQCGSGLFAIFMHFARGKNSKSFTDDLALSFILGTESFLTIMWLAFYTFIFLLFFNVQDFDATILTFILAGICFMLSFFCALFYFRKGKKSTALFLPRSIVSNYLIRIKTVRTRLDAFLLGFFANLPEFFMTLPLFIVGAIILQASSTLIRPLTIISTIIITVVPLFIIRFFYRTGHNLAEIERLRIKLKPHFRFILTLAYLALAIALTIYGVINYGS